MMKISTEEKQQIKEAIAKAEETTFGEIVPMILKSSDNYPAAHFRCAILMGLIFAFGLYYFPYYEVSDSLYYIWFMIAGMLIGHSLAYKNKIKKFFLSKKEIAEEVHQRAIEAFFYEGVHNTKDRTGILLFISTLEQRAELIADSGINEKVDKDTWDKILNTMLQEIKKGDAGKAICTAVASCGDLLQQHFPKTTQEHKIDPNELKDDVITD